MTVANYAYFADVLGYTCISAVSRKGGRCDVLEIVFWDADTWSFIVTFAFEL